jgi:MFS family permease
MAKYDSSSFRAKLTITTLLLLAFYDGLCTTYLFQYIETLIIEFGVVEVLPASEPFVYWLGNSFEIGRLFTTLFWGDSIDQKGEKNTIANSLLLFAISNLAFGFCSNYFLAFVLRMVSGACLGLLVSIKSILAEYKNETLRMWVTPLVFTFWSAGNTLGPYVGSLFFNASEIGSHILGACLISGLGIVLRFLAGNIDISSERLLRNEFGENTKNTFLDQDGTIAYSDDLSLAGKYKKIISMTNSNKLSVLGALLLFYSLSLGLLLPVWITNTLDANGLNIQSIDVDPFLVIMTLPAFVLQVGLFPCLVRKFNNFMILTKCNWIQFAIFFALPFTVRFIALGDGGVGMWLGFCLLVRNCATLMMMCSIQEFTNGSVIKAFRGKINAIQVLLSSLVTIGVPLLFGAIIDYAFNPDSTSNLRYGVPFIFLATLSGLATKITYDLEFEDLEKNKIISDSARYVMLQLS